MPDPVSEYILSRRCREEPIDAVDTVRDNLDLEMSRLIGKEERKFDDKTFTSACAGLSLGAAVYDRFKDLLAKSILDDLLAREEGRCRRLYHRHSASKTT